jgi:hypothetical protein
MDEETIVVPEGMTMDAEYAGNATRDGWESRRWNCEIRYNGRRMVVKFGKGMGLDDGPPTLREVLACVVSDAMYDDPREAEGIELTIPQFLEIREQTSQLRRLLGDDLLERMMTGDA